MIYEVYFWYLKRCQKNTFRDKFPSRLSLIHICKCSASMHRIDSVICSESAGKISSGARENVSVAYARLPWHAPPIINIVIFMTIPFWTFYIIAASKRSSSHISSKNPAKSPVIPPNCFLIIDTKTIIPSPRSGIANSAAFKDKHPNMQINPINQMVKAIFAVFRSALRCV